MKQQASLISMVVVLFLTAGKFTAYFLSGSLTVFTEAWHGFSDVATTLLVLLAIWISQREPQKDKVVAEQTRLNRFLQIFYKRAELKAAVMIGLALTVISITIMWQVIVYQPRVINNALGIGLFFLLFSTGSYFLYRFQHRSGEMADSPALKADSLHSRADMVTAALTGFTLIFYHFDIDIDRFVAGFLSLYIGSFSLELLVNSILAIKRGEEQTYQFREILTGLLSFKTYHILFKFIFPNRGAQWQAHFEKVIKRLLYLILLTPIVIWLTTIFYTIEPYQQGIREQLGGSIELVNPGLHLKWPWPINRVVKVDRERIRTTEVGNIAKGMMIWSQRHGTDIQEWLTGDDAFMIPYLEVHYRVRDSVQFYYTQRNPKGIIQGLIYRGMSETFARQTFYELALHNRIAWQQKLKERVQNELNQLNSGMEIVSLFLKDLHPPMAVSLSYENVIATGQEQEQLLNEVESYRIRKEKQGEINVLRRRVRGSIYRIERQMRIELELSQFQIYDQLTPLMGGIKERLRWESRLKTFAKKPLILVDQALTGIDLWLVNGKKVNK